MLRRRVMLLLLIAAATCGADELAAPVKTESAEATPVESDAAKPKGDAGSTGGGKTLSGMSILGNQEAPKALVIVPWKSSEIGDPLGLDESLDGARRPVDKEVFMRELDYYEIKSGSR